MECSRRKEWSVGGGRGRTYRINRKSGENREMIRWRAVGVRERWGELAVRGGDDQVENVIFVVRRKVNMLSKGKGGDKRQKLRGEVISRIIKMNVKVASNDEFVRCGSSEREE